MTELSSDLHNVSESLKKNNYCLLSLNSYQESRELCCTIGEIIYENDISPNLRSRSLSNSFKALDFHTDHHIADYIGIFCIEQSDIGGETVLVDSYEVLKMLTENERECLKGINLYEHKIFEDDNETHSMLMEINGVYKIYYSYWLMKNEMDVVQKEVFEKFRAMTHTAKQIRFKLKPNELLIFDNRRLLHSRTEIGKGEKRLLKRVWVKI